MNRGLALPSWSRQLNVLVLRGDLTNQRSKAFFREQEHCGSFILYFYEGDFLCR